MTLAQADTLGIAAVIQAVWHTEPLEVTVIVSVTATTALALQPVPPMLTL